MKENLQPSDANSDTASYDSLLAEAGEIFLNKYPDEYRDRTSATEGVRKTISFLTSGTDSPTPGTYAMMVYLGLIEQVGEELAIKIAEHIGKRSENIPDYDDPRGPYGVKVRYEK